MQNRGLTLWLSILTGFQALTAGTVLSGFIGEKWAGFAALIASVLMTATTTYVASQPKPQEAVKVHVPMEVNFPNPATFAAVIPEKEEQ